MQKEISKVDSIYFKNFETIGETTAAIAPNTPIGAKPHNVTYHFRIA